MGSKTICLCCLFFVVLFTSPFVILITLSYVGVKPRFYIQEIYIPSLNNSNTHNNATNLNTSIFIDLKFKRVVAHVPLRYEDVNITLYYGSNRSFGAVGSYVVAGFSQGKKKTARRRAVVEARGLPWEDAFEKISGGSAVALAVELATKYKLRRCDEGNCYYTKPKTVVVAADLVVDASGLEVSKKPIRLH
ncbi:uncharacterized protein LOC131007867 [Salvia miltiorrhiza]|uniref:uncharacterized protein LOC131007857 n=1 Tax=Salvia miltiorrhiza TaxID=226208 RepID=UPI0025AD1F61|nr:uncharacterized protein LOC131007857 [Salvia miltiorrhiza]XP_057790764.1 uncharacterized protein LOC131007867 [Salvia miltiorrhiza]